MSVLRPLFMLLAIASAVWLAVLWHWETQHRDISSADILMQLVLLPLTLFALLMAGRWAWRGAAARVAALPEASAGPVATAAAPAQDPPPDAAVLQLLAAHVRCAAGDSVAAVLEASEAGAPRPALAEALRDGRGLPVLVAQVPAPDTAELARALDPAGTDTPPEEAELRALALLAPLLPAAIDDLSTWRERFDATQPAAEQRRLHVLAAWPADWPLPRRQRAQQWLTEQLGAALADGLAPEALLIQPPAVQDGIALWQQAEQLLAAGTDGEADALLLAACHSDIDAPAVERLEQAGALFGSAVASRGQVPGEGAAVLLLAGPGWAPSTPAPPRLHRAAVARRETAVDAPGRPSSQLAGTLLQQALQAAGANAAEVAGLANDADEHSPRGAEMYGAMLAQLPALDAGHDQRMAGHLCGRLGAVAPLLAIAMAAQRAADDERPWAALSVADPHWRLALLARPAAPPPPPV